LSGHTALSALLLECLHCCEHLRIRLIGARSSHTRRHHATSLLWHATPKHLRYRHNTRVRLSATLSL
jgi:hypothetical protein